MRTTGAETTRGRATAGAWGGPFTLGVGITLLGLVALLATTATGVASVMVVGALVAAAGVLEVISAFRLRGAGRFLVYFLGGLFSVVVGAILLLRPLVGLAAVALLLAGFFLASGLFRGVTSLMDRYTGWGWDLFYGVVAVFLGASIMAGWPLSSLWIVGVVVGVEIAVRGIAIMAGSLRLRRVLRAGAAA